MKRNKLKIVINRTAIDVFRFYINPKNTPLWLDSIVQEETSDWPIKVGTVYRNQNKDGRQMEYIVTGLIWDKMFELASKDGNYHVRYSHKTINSFSCELTYEEWMDKNEIQEPFTIKTLRRLKSVLEKK